MGVPDLRIREMRSDDYHALVELWEAARLPYHPEGRDSEVRILKELGTPMSLFLVAESEGLMVGSLLGTSDGRKGWVNRLAVHPRWQRKGIALALLKEMERRFDERGILVLCALIQDDNPSSKRFFEGAGYEEDRGAIYYSKRKSKEV